MRRIALLALVALALPTAVDAQARLMVGGGISSPSGDFGDNVDTGQHVRVGLQVGVPVFPVALRGEGEIHNFSEATGSDQAKLINGTVSGVVSLGGIGLSPYIIAGIGSYRFDASAAEAVTNRGIHGGFGASIGALGLGGFAEVRLVKIDGDATDTRYIAGTIGFRF
jgi:hypothetical protein